MGRTGVFYKNFRAKTERGPIIYGWLHNSPFARQNAFSWFQEENRDVRKTIINHTARAVKCRDFYQLFMGRVPGHESRPVPLQALINELSSPGPYTLLCPSNNALGRISQDSWDEMATTPGLLAKFLRRHVLKGKHSVKEIVTGKDVDFVNNGSDINSDSYGFQTTVPGEDNPIDLELINLDDRVVPFTIVNSLEQQFFMEGSRKVLAFNCAPIVKSSRCWNGWVHAIEGVGCKTLPMRDTED